MNIAPSPSIAGGRRVYADAAAWAAEMHGTARAANRTAWLAAGASSLAAVLLGGALASLGPLRTLAPYTVRVEQQAGQAQAALALAPGPLTTDPAMTDAFLAQYVLLRERYRAGRLEKDYGVLAVWSDPVARARYAAEITRSNPASPLVRYPGMTTVTPSITSVSRLSPTQALVRFTTSTQDATASVAQQQGWLASITYRTEAAPLTNRQRIGNPLGYRVTDYRRDPDGSLLLTTPVLP